MAKAMAKARTTRHIGPAAALALAVLLALGLTLGVAGAIAQANSGKVASSRTAVSDMSLADETSAAASEGAGGSFLLAVVSDDGSYLVEPSEVQYTSGQTARAALEATSYQFVFSSSGFLQSVKGHAPQNATYLYCYTDYASRTSNLFDDIDASTLTSVYISAYSSGAGEGHVAALDAMSTYNEHAGGLHNYDAAVQAYNAIATGLPTATSDGAQTLASNLLSAIQDYDDMMQGTQYPVEFAVTRGGSSYSAYTATLTDQYGNQTQAENGIANVVAGTYSYEVADADGKNLVRGTSFVVSEGAEGLEITADLPSGNWFGSIQLIAKSDNSTACPAISGSAASRQVTYAVPDTTSAYADLYTRVTASGYLQSISDYQTAYPLYAVYTGVNGTAYTQTVGYNASSYAPQNMVAQGLGTNDVDFEIRHYLNDAHTQMQVEVCSTSLLRSPTLSSISVVGDNQEYMTGFAASTLSYDVVVGSDTLTIAPTAFVKDSDRYSVTVDGEALSEDGTATVSLPDSASTAPYQVPVTVTLDDDSSLTRTYTLNITKAGLIEQAFTHDSNVTVKVCNAAGSVVEPVSESSTQTVFKLIEGQSYKYVGTRDTYYHVSKEFEASGDTTAVSTPSNSDLVQKIVLAYDGFYDLDPSKDSSFPDASTNMHEHTYTVPDNEHRSSMRVVPASGADPEEYTVSYAFSSQTDGSDVTGELTYTEDTKYNSKYHKGSLSGLVRNGGYGNSVLLTVTMEDATSAGETQYQEYNASVVRKLTLSSVSASSDSGPLVMTQTATASADEPVTGFDASVTDYTVGVPSGTDSVDIGFRFPQMSSISVVSGGYTATLDGKTTPYQSDGVQNTQTVVLDTSQSSQTFEIVVSHEDPSSQSTTYKITVQQLPRVSMRFVTSPDTANINLIEDSSGNRIMPASDGTYTVVDGYSYTWTAVASGYVGQTGTFTAADGLRVTVSLTAADPNPAIDTAISAEWPLFRKDSTNNSVIDGPTPTSADDTVLYWATQLGSGYDSSAAGCPILVDGYLYTYARNQIYKLDTVTGEVVAQGSMAGTSSFAITPMTYAQGMVFVGLSNGRVQAFNAKTLESLWVYTSPNGGQPNCPISYSDGKIYTGFWNYTKMCDFVCLTITDEDPTQTAETKQPLWTNPHYGGYYWAGAYAGENFVLEGSDNAALAEVLSVDATVSASGTVYSFDPDTGKILDQIDSYPGGVEIGNIRSTIQFDTATSTAYYVSRNGYFVSVKVNSDGTFDHGSIKTLKLVNNNPSGVVSSTATPVIYNGRAYIDADSGSYNAYDGQCVDVIDLDSWSIAYTVNMGGRAQSTPVLTTAYESTDGYVYLYFFDNFTPGKLRYFKDQPGQTSAIDGEVETTTSAGSTIYHNVASVLFCPAQAQAQYCICSPVVDSNGTIYFKNDSAYMMAVGATIDSLEVTQNPDTTQYPLNGELDTTGIKVVAHYSNGTARDITEYVQYSHDDFSTVGEYEVTVKFPYTMYQCKSTSDKIGVAPDYNYDCPTTSFKVSVAEEMAAHITTTELPDGLAATALQRTAYSATLEAVADPAEITWTMSGTLPEGLSFDASTAMITGYPAAGTGGVYNLSFTATNSVGSDAKDLALTIDETPVVTSDTLENAKTGVEYSAKLQATGYPQDFTWTHNTSIGGSSNKLPAGLTLSADGTISGTPTEGGTFRFYVNASNDAGSGDGHTSTAKLVTLTVEDTRVAPSIVTTSLGDALVGSDYSATLQVGGYPAPAVTVSGLPDGLAFDASTLTISGKPTTAGEYTVKVEAANGKSPDATATLKLTVTQSPAIATSALGNALLGSNYSQTIEVAGTPTPEVAVSGLPEGLAYDDATRKISGVPTQQGTFDVTVRASNGIEPAATRVLTLMVTSPASIVTDSLASGEVGKAYSQQILTSGTPSPTVEVSGLPAGLAYSNGAIVGVPTQDGTFEVTLSAGNGVGAAASSKLQLFVDKASVPVKVVTTELPSVAQGQSYSQTLTINGYPMPTTTVTGLPAGLAYDDATRTISGTPTAAPGSYTVTVTASNTAGDSDTATMTLVVGEPLEAPQITTVELANPVIGYDYNQAIEATGNPAPTVTVEGLPEGLTYADGKIAGMVESVGAGSYTVTVSAVNGVAPAAQREFTIQITQAPEVLTTSLDEGMVSVAYSQTIEATGIPTPTIEVSGLPAGLAFDASSQTISGTPTEAGSYTVRVVATNGAGARFVVDLPLEVVEYGEAPTIVTASLDDATTGVEYSQTIEVTGSPAPKVTVTGLPNGLTFDASTLKIGGTPTRTGTYNVVVRADNGYGDAAELRTTIAVAKGSMTWTRLAGSTRLNTMQALAQEGYSDSSCSDILLAYGWGYADALTASSLSGLWDAPIVTTDSWELSDEARSEIARLSNGSTTVHILGGTGVVSNAVASQVASLPGVASVDRIAGESRVDTGLKIYEAGEGSWGDTCIITNAWNYADALGIGSWAAVAGAPIFGTTGGQLNDYEAEAIRTGGFTNILVLGGDAAVDYNAVKSKLGKGYSYTRLAGSTRLETSKLVAYWTTGDENNCGFEANFMPEKADRLTFDGMGVATAWNYPDALVSVDVLARQHSVMLLLDDSDESYGNVASIVGGHKNSMTKGYIFGGSSAVSTTVERWLNEASN